MVKANERNLMAQISDRTTKYLREINEWNIMYPDLKENRKNDKHAPLVVLGMGLSTRFGHLYSFNRSLFKNLHSLIKLTFYIY